MCVYVCACMHTHTQTFCFSSQSCATQAMLAEPGFQFSCLEFLTGGNTAETATGSILPTGTEKSFSFSNCKCVYFIAGFFI